MLPCVDPLAVVGMVRLMTPRNATRKGKLLLVSEEN